MRRSIAMLLAAAGLPSAALAQQATPLFASDAPIQITIRGPINSIARGSERSTAAQPATMSLAGTDEIYAIQLSPRGISRRRKEVCQFPPLRVDLIAPPAATSLFAGQRRLKLVTHCRSSQGFQQHTMLEYLAYRLFNLVTPMSFRARLATVNYLEPDGRNVTTRTGFFIEDIDDIAHRNGSTRARVGDRVASAQLDPMQAARVALFQYMIGNLDWSMRAGPQGAGCCHNSRLLMRAGSSFMPVPYDFDHSGLVDAPYATPPEIFRINSVRTRVYQGYCRHNDAALAAAAELRSLRPAIEGELARLPGLDDRTRRKAQAYLSGFFAEVATDQSLRARVLKKCMG